MFPSSATWYSSVKCGWWNGDRHHNTEWWRRRCIIVFRVNLQGLHHHDNDEGKYKIEQHKLLDGNVKLARLLLMDKTREKAPQKPKTAASDDRQQLLLWLLHSIISKTNKQLWIDTIEKLLVWERCVVWYSQQKGQHSSTRHRNNTTTKRKKVVSNNKVEKKKRSSYKNVGGERSSFFLPCCCWSGVLQKKQTDNKQTQICKNCTAGEI